MINSEAQIAYIACKFGYAQRSGSLKFPDFEYCAEELGKFVPFPPRTCWGS
jgi:hypothetical protein